MGRGDAIVLGAGDAGRYGIAVPVEDLDVASFRAQVYAVAHPDDEREAAQRREVVGAGGVDELDAVGTGDAAL
ncbi:hypothetical protein [Streptomyces mirabilis]|uniref:hypothetical protein n=1 Tax=Streptomyces mirabilis TaxID=68239 RepID=UPI0036573A49